MKLAIALEKKYTKDQILEGYLNIVFFNRDAYGIEAASKFFFSTTAKDLTLPQAALLAGLVNSPVLLRSHHQPGKRQEPAQPGAGRDAQHRAKSRRPTTTPPSPPRSKPRSPRHGRAAPTATTAPYFCDYVSTCS